MKKYTKTYYEFFDYPLDPTFVVPCELTGGRSVDIHHIDAAGMGSNNRDDASAGELMALTRLLHNLFGDKTHLKDFLKEAHLSFMVTEVPFIEINPLHKGFDVLLGTEYESGLLRKRHLFKKYGVC